MKINFEKINSVFKQAEAENRHFLLEHEVYEVLRQVGIKTPRCLFVKKGQSLDDRRKGLLLRLEDVLENDDASRTQRFIQAGDEGRIRYRSPG